ncbi:hypothetical protein FNV43_RR27006 [Rhamnella rubrinervis]|uniref:DUF1985 domain-containing protein n=1 Tax=Rhamnella rubrinervis TaxID=2594499 RepID=A0A8K0GK70_9ROSA|nr:hypothetical protein FNV43_RR27006 [Rhamnella rubrinervis]
MFGGPVILQVRPAIVQGLHIEDHSLIKWNGRKRKIDSLRPFPKGLSYNSPAKWQVRPAKWQGWIPDSKQPVVRRAGWQGGPAVLQGLLYSSTCKMVCCPAQWPGGTAMWQVVKRLIPVDKKYHAHLTSNSNITFALNVIKNKLSKGMDKSRIHLLENFEPRVFTWFHSPLLLNQVECDDTNVMEFDFHGIGARFDRKSFAMITGLNCSKFPNEKELEHLPYDLWVKYFGDTGPMSQSDFIKAFEDLDFDESDEEVENNVVWGFETIPAIVTLAPRGKYHGVMCPRMLGWSCPSTLQYTKLAAEVFDRNDTASHPPCDQISDLKLQISELRSDLVAMRTELRSELQQQRNEIQNISSLVRQLVDQFCQRMVMDQEIDAAMYYIRKRITNNPQLFDQRCIVTDCMFWASMHGRYVKYLKKSPNEEEDELTKDADWEKEMRDSPFDMYALGMLPVGSKSWLDIDYDGMEDRHHAVQYSLIFTFNIGEEGLQDGGPPCHPCRPSSSNLHIGTGDGMEDRHHADGGPPCHRPSSSNLHIGPAGWHGGPAIMRPDLLIQLLRLVKDCRMAGPSMPSRLFSSNLHIWTSQDDMEDRHHAVRFTNLLRLVRKDLQDGRSSMPYCRAFLIQSSYRDLQDGMEDRHHAVRIH